MKNIGKIIIASLLIICIIWIAIMNYNAVNGKTASISVSGDTIYTLNLDETQRLEIQGENNITLEVECGNGQIRVISSECPDKICVKKGFISMTNENIVCLPAKIIIKIDGDEKIIE